MSSTANKREILEPPPLSLLEDNSLPVQGDKILSETVVDSQSSAFWAYLIIVIIFSLLALVIIFDSWEDGWFQKITLHQTLPIGLHFLIWMFFLTILVCIAYFSHIEVTNSNTQLGLTFIFIIHLALLLAWIIILYNKRNLMGGRTLAILAFISALVWLVLVWPLNPLLAAGLGLYSLWLLIQITQIKISSLAECRKVRRESNLRHT